MTAVDTKIENEFNNVRKEIKSEIDSMKNRLNSAEKSYASVVKKSNQTNTEDNERGKNIIGKMFPVDKNETPTNNCLKNNVISMVKDGMKLKNVIVERKQSNEPRPGVVIARLQSKQNKVEIMEKKKELRKIQKYRNVYIESDIPYETRVANSNMRTILKEMGKLNDFKVSQGKLVRNFQRNQSQLNGRCSDTSDYIEGVDELPIREVIDQGSNANGDLLIDFLVDCNMCMINGRKGKQGFSCISKRGKSVVDYIFTTHENLNSCKDFDVKTMSDIIDCLNLQECNQIPDHSVLQAVIKREAAVPLNTVLKFPTNLKRIPNKPKSYQIPNDFLNDDNAREKNDQTINKIENALADRRDVDEAYSNLFQLINSEVLSKIGQKSAHDDQHKITSRKSKYKQYWNENLQEHWDKACEQEKQEMISINFCERKKNYQLRQQKELFNLSKESNTKDFWRKIGKLGIAKDRQNTIPTEVLLSNGNISKDINIVYETWKNEYEHLYNTSDGEYVERFLTFIQQQVNNNLVNKIENNSDTLNSDISYEDVEKSVYRTKLNKFTGLDQICAEFLRNNSCVDMIFKIIKFAFDNEVVPETWNQILINPILKPDKDNRDPLGYRVIALMSISCKTYADILNVRLSS
ncbi:unnamed protein product [Mytilus coruscus]|uniref:Uncharacterized protein n=1 Tax=Mytilus coruscus TaxID=42192 RepID=A0A6J8B927_MYTCO|nr:unnamed protein product [Mytilus coruscus]